MTTTTLTAARIREAREAAGLSQTALAERVGVHQPAVSEWESGQKTPRASSLVRLARALDITTDWLLGLD